MRLAANLRDLRQREREQALVRHEVIHHAELECLFGDDCFACENDVERLGQADEAREPRAAAPRGEDAELNFRQSELRGLVGCGVAEVAREADLEAAAQGRAVNRGGSRQRERGEPAEDALAKLDDVAQRVHRRGGERVQVCASDEDAGLGAGEHDAAKSGVAFDGVEVGVQLLQRGAVEDVRGGVRPVESKDGDGVGGGFAAEVFELARGGSGLGCVHRVKVKLLGCG